MKRIIFAFLCAITCIGLNADAETQPITQDWYDFKIIAKVPRIYDNTTSMGYRKYQTQRIQGNFIVTYYDDGSKEFKCENMVNLTHKINSNNVTYKCRVDNYGDFVYPRWNAIGNNRTQKFDVSSTAFYIDMEPSYNIGEDEPDNSLLLTFAGYGRMASKQYIYWCGYQKNYITIKVCRYVYGFAAGTMGCGCRAYGHTSPTRILDACGPSDRIDDVASVYAKFRLTFKRRYDCN